MIPWVGFSGIADIFQEEGFLVQMNSRLKDGKLLGRAIQVELPLTVKKGICAVDPGKDKPYFSGPMILLFSGDVMKKLFKDKPSEK